MSKKRRQKAVPNFPGIYENQIQDSVTGKWKEPKRGAKYLVARPSKGADRKFKREYESFHSFTEAKEFRNRINSPQLVTVQPVETLAKGITLEELIGEWKVNWLPNKAITTQVRYISYLPHFDFLKEKYVEEIEPTDIDRWIAHLKQPEYLSGYHSTRLDYEHEFRILRLILNYYITRKNRNYRLPFVKDHKEMLKVREKKKISQDLTVEQFSIFISTLKQDVMNTLYEMVFYLAMMQYLIYGRVQDAAGLHFESFDFKNRKINVNNKVQWVRRKGMNDIIAEGSKANSGKQIEMSELAAAFFREWTMKAGIRSGPLFLMNGKIISYRVIQYRYNKALKKAGLPFTATHILRHASLTEYYDGCKDLLATARVAGHSDTRTTAKYAKVRSVTLTENQRQMDEKLSGLKDLQKS